jgi:Flp pilus assembly protein TadG
MRMARERFCRFLRGEDGGGTVEFTLLVPAFLSFIVFAADTATSYSRQSNLWSVSQQTARIVARHGMDAAEGARFAAERMRIGDYTPEIAVNVDEGAQLVTVVVTADAAAIAPFGLLRRAFRGPVTVAVSQALEPI